MIRKTIFLVTGTVTGLAAVLSYNPPKLNETIATSQKAPKTEPSSAPVNSDSNTPTSNKKDKPKNNPPAQDVPAAITGDFVGDTVQTRWGPVQVQITVANGVITDISTLKFPNGDRRSQSISNQVLPWLQDEVLNAQSANITGISGATYTSNGFKKSLASALQKAGI